VGRPGLTTMPPVSHGSRVATARGMFRFVCRPMSYKRATKNRRTCLVDQTFVQSVLNQLAFGMHLHLPQQTRAIGADGLPLSASPALISFTVLPVAMPRMTFKPHDPKAAHGRAVTSHGSGSWPTLRASRALT